MPDLSEARVTFAAYTLALDDVLDNCHDRAELLLAATHRDDMPEETRTAFRCVLCDLQRDLMAALKAVRPLA